MLIRRIYIALVLPVFLFTGLLLVAEGCSRGDSAKPGSDIQRIILVTIDTLRADHLGSYGYPRNTSPFLDQLASEGVIFTRAIAATATTSPSHASIFTSLHPLQHQVLKNGMILDDAVLTMAEVLEGMGYLTAGFVGTNVHFIRGNMHQGFQVFNEPEVPADIGLKRGDVLEGIEVMNAGRGGSHVLNRYADSTIDAVLGWLRQGQSADKLFLWVHLFDPHGPTHRRQPFYQSYAQVTEDQERSFARYLVDEHKIELDFYRGNVSRMLNNVNRYDSEISFADDQLKRLYDFMEAEGLNRNALWVITADHGEGLGNHFWYSHGKHLYSEQIRVPLIFKHPSRFASGRVVGSVVEHVDILPTIIELAGGKLNGQLLPPQGESLAPLLDGRNEGFKKKFALSQRRVYNSLPPKEIDPWKTHFEHGEKFSYQNRSHKYIHRTEGPDEFYALDEDPHELDNLAGRGSEEEELLRSRLLTKIQTLLRDVDIGPQKAPQEVIEQLKALGYVE